MQCVKIVRIPPPKHFWVLLGYQVVVPNLSLLMLCFLLLMAPPNNPIDTQEKIMGKCFDLSYGKFSVSGVALFSEAPRNVFFSPFCSIWAIFWCTTFPYPGCSCAVLQKGGFLGFHKEKPSNRLINSLGWVNSMVEIFLASLGSNAFCLPCGWEILGQIYK